MRKINKKTRENERREEDYTNDGKRVWLFTCVNWISYINKNVYTHTHSEGMSIVTLLDAMLLLIHTRVFVYYIRNANDADPYACVNVKSQYFINKYWYWSVNICMPKIWFNSIQFPF